jgi:hypothetical protein
MPARARHVTDTLVDGELVIYDPAHQRLHVLNGTASLIWRLCDGLHSEESLVNSLLRRYPDGQSTIAADIQTILERFRDEGLIEP